ncbi:hypothetical protein AB0M58_14405 [Streptomyces bobili]|uniref:hypothetical protein n=1 Tax=Streptomyces bobili TaxID=67280 RepID=UPI003439050D
MVDEFDLCLRVAAIQRGGAALRGRDGTTLCLTVGTDEELDEQLVEEFELVSSALFGLVFVGLRGSSRGRLGCRAAPESGPLSVQPRAWSPQRFRLLGVGHGQVPSGVGVLWHGRVWLDEGASPPSPGGC